MTDTTLGAADITLTEESRAAALEALQLSREATS